MKDKNEQPERQEKTLVIDITPTRGLLILLALVLVTAACLGTLAWGQKEAAADTQAAPAAFTGMRKYYLSQSGVDGDEALTACAAGYHMASLWEILDPSNLEYNTDLGATRADSGAGPPILTRVAWVRTGWDSEGSTGNAGQDNCEAWTSDDSSALGTAATLSYRWTSGDADMHVWDARGSSSIVCSGNLHVWCVEDYPTLVYLPLVLKD